MSMSFGILTISLKASTKSLLMKCGVVLSVPILLSRISFKPLDNAVRINHIESFFMLFLLNLPFSDEMSKFQSLDLLMEYWVIDPLGLIDRSLNLLIGFWESYLQIL